MVTILCLDKSVTIRRTFIYFNDVNAASIGMQTGDHVERGRAFLKVTDHGSQFQARYFLPAKTKKNVTLCHDILAPIKEALAH